MTDEQILSLVQEHFTEGGIHDDGSCSEWYGNTDAFLKFARAIRQDGYTEGYDDDGGGYGCETWAQGRVFEDYNKTLKDKVEYLAPDESKTVPKPPTNLRQ